MSNTEATRYEVRQGAAWITLNRPDNRNALSAVLVNELADHIAAALADPAARCIVITGADPAFCAGADLKNPPGSATEGRKACRPAGYPATDDERRQAGDRRGQRRGLRRWAGPGGRGRYRDHGRRCAEFSFSEVRIGVIPAIIAVVCLPKLGPTTR
jgi:methylglutaconyl-CoA hydratase